MGSAEACSPSAASGLDGGRAAAPGFFQSDQGKIEAIGSPQWPKLKSYQTSLSVFDLAVAA